MRSSIGGGQHRSVIRSRQLLSAISHWFWGGGSGGVDTWVAPTLLGADTVFFFSSSRLKTMFQEVTVFNADNSVGVPITPSDEDAESVGLIYDSSNNALKMSAASNTVKPTLTSGGGRNTGLDFSGTQYLRILNSQSILKNIHKASTPHSFGCWIKKDVDGTLMCIMGNTAGSTNNNGIHFSTTAANKIQAFCTFGTAGQNVYTHTSTASVLAADGWVSLIVVISGVGAGQGAMYIGSNAPETFTVSANGSNNLATGLFTVGANSSLGQFYNGQIDNWFCVNRALTADEITNFKSYNPVRDNSNFFVKEIEYDFNDTATIWADTTKTTPITDGVAIAAMTNKLPTNFGPRTDDLSQSTAGLRPLYQANIVNGLGVAEYDGVDDTLPFLEVTERGGSFVIYVVAENIDNTNGSRPLYAGSSSSYGVITGDNYVTEPPNPRAVIHENIGSESVSAQLDNTKAYNVFAYRKSGTSMKIFTDNGSTDEDTSSLQFALNGIGFSNQADWFMHGNVAKIIKYNGYKTDAQITAEVNALSAAYN